MFPKPTWINISQPTAGDAWVYSALVNLDLANVPSSQWGDLPPAVRAKVKNLSGTAFSVQQLVFDLANATLTASTPTLTGVPAKFKAVLNDIIVTEYFKASQAKGQPIVGVAVKQPPSTATLELTGLNFMVNPYMDAGGVPQPRPTNAQKQQASLNYLCTTRGDFSPAPSRFTWNWLDSQQLEKSDGVVAINRNTLARYFTQQLSGFAAANCYNASVNVSVHGFLDTEVSYSWGMTRNQHPTIVTPTSGPTVLSLSHSSSASDQAGLGGDMGRMTLSPSYTMTLAFSGTSIVIYQHLNVYLYVRSLATSASGNIINETITDTYDLSIDKDGTLQVSSPKVVRTNNSQNPGTGGFLNFFTGLNSIINDVKGWSNGFVPTQFTNIPVAFAQGFVFPGGRTFNFDSVAFSDDQDLVSLISYA